MTPILPARFLGSSLLVEARPIELGLCAVFRGVDLEAQEPAPPRGPTAQGPYRHAPPVPPPAQIPVIVRELADHGGDPEIPALFERVTRARQRMTGSPTPALRRTLGREGRVLVSVEEYVAGVSLREVLGRTSMPPEIALAIGRGLLSMWAAAEAESLPIRFYVDPHAVLVDAAGRVRVIPQYTEEEARQAVGAAVALMSATVSYISPEQLTNARADARSAMYSLGLLLFEMLSGSHPFDAGHASMFELLSKMALNDVPPLRHRRPDLPPRVIDLVHRCLARDPAQRFPSWRELSHAFGAAQGLFPRTGPADVARYVAGLLPPHAREAPPPVADPSTWPTLLRTPYVEMPLPQPPPARDLRRAPSRPRAAPDPEVVYAGNDARPMYAASAQLWIDARPVTRAEHERFCIVTGTPRPASFAGALAEGDDDPCTGASVEEAEAYARWAGKRLPTDAEWSAAVAALGAARLGVGEVWEWTATVHEQGGRVVRGGPWRNQGGQAGQAENRALEAAAAADIGFRCVAEAR